MSSIDEQLLMPKLWRYLLFNYLQLFSLALFSFVGILLVCRFKDLARFACLTANWGKTALFLAYQIPIIFPMAAPISAVIGAFVLLQRLSRNGELTALRSSGIGLKSLFTPLFFISFFLSFLHFAVCTEIVPKCRRESRILLYQESSANPLLILQKQGLLKIPNLSLKMKVKEEGKSAEELLLLSYNEALQRLSLISADQLHLHEQHLMAQNLRFITTFLHEGKEALLIDTQGKIEMEIPSLSSLIGKNRPSLDASSFNFPMLRLRAKEPGKAASARVEMWRRISLSLSLLSFTLLGFSFGIQLHRIPSKKGLIQVLFLVLGFLVCYLLGRALKQEQILSTLAFFLPHPLLWLFSLLHLRKIYRGL